MCRALWGREMCTTNECAYAFKVTKVPLDATLVEFELEPVAFVGSTMARKGRGIKLIITRVDANVSSIRRELQAAKRVQRRVDEVHGEREKEGAVVSICRLSKGGSWFQEDPGRHKHEQRLTPVASSKVHQTRVYKEQKEGAIVSVYDSR